MSTFVNTPKKQNMILLTIKETFGDKIIYLIGSFVVLLMPHLYSFAAIGVLVFVDLATGILASRQRPKSRGIYFTIVKMLIYMMLLLGSIFAEKLMTDSLPFIEVALLIISVSEILSIYENVGRFLGVDLKKWVISRFAQYKMDFPVKKKKDNYKKD